MHYLMAWWCQDFASCILFMFLFLRMKLIKPLLGSKGFFRLNCERIHDTKVTEHMIRP
jgi:hypothetical protein